MGNSPKISFIFSVLAAIGLAACGGGGSPAPESQQGNPTISFPAPGTNAPIVEADVTDLGECGALPGEWKFLDLTTGAPMALDVKPLSTFQNKFQKSWGGTTTAHAVWRIEPSDMEVWNEGRILHVGSDTPLTTTGMIAGIALAGTPGNMTALIGTDRGLVIADLTRSGDHWSLKQQVTIDAVGAVRSVATTNLILEKDGPHVPMVFMVASDAVLMAKLEDLRANFGCLSVAYQAKDHPVEPKNPANPRVFHPVKIVTSQDYAAFLTAARPPEEFANADQLQLTLNKEWLSFQSTAFLIDLTRQYPVAPIITTMGTFDRFFASDISMSNIGVFLYGSRYNSANPAALESGIASYKNLQAVTPVVSLWSRVKEGLPGDYRMGRMETNITTAYIRGLDRLAQVENFLSGPTQIKWATWPDKLSLEYVRSVNYKKSADSEGKPLQILVTVPQYLPTGPTFYVWEYKDYSKELKEGCLAIGSTDKCVPDILGYTAAPPILDATSTDVSFFDIAYDQVMFHHLGDNGFAQFPLFGSGENSQNAHTPKMFHTENYVFYVRHGSDGAITRIYNDSVIGNVDLSKNGPAITGFCMTDNGQSSNSCLNVAVNGFSNMAGKKEHFRIDDIRQIGNPSLPNLQHFAILLHSWDGAKNNYRVVIFQVDLLTPNKNKNLGIQGCSDISDPQNNYSGNVGYGVAEERLRFLGPLTSTLNPDGSLNYKGLFQRFNSSYNVWKLNIKVTNKDALDTSCKHAGELIPLTDPAVSESVSAVLSGNTLLGLHSNGLVKWKIDATTTQFLDVGANILGAPVTLESGQLLGLAGMLFARMDTPDGFHPVTLFSQDGSFGESCTDCQFTDAFTADPLLLTAHPERGVELYDFSK